MSIGLYCRVSTDEQAKHGHSIEAQMHRLEAYCHSQGWDDFEFYIDDGYTGTNMDRPQLKRLLRHIDQGKVESVIVYRLDRLSRRQRDILFLIEDVFTTKGVSFRSATEPFDTSTPLGRAMLGILSVFAQLERDTIVERSRSGIAQRARKGLWHGGPVPFGYQWNTDEKTIEIEPVEAPLVREVFDQFLRGKAFNQIATWLKKRNTSRYVDHAFISDMLQRSVYAGFVPFNGDNIKGQHEPIISEEVWQQTQDELAKRQDGRHPYGKYLLSNLGQCGMCGGNMKVQRRKHPKYDYVYHYYMCANRQMNGKESCPDSKQIVRHKLEGQVIDILKQMGLDPSVLMDEIDSKREPDDHQDEIASLREELDGIAVKMDNLIGALRDGVLTSKYIKPHVDELETRREQIEARLDELESVERTAKEPDELIAILQTIGKSWDLLTEAEQREVLRDAVQKVIVYPNKPPKLVWNIV